MVIESRKWLELLLSCKYISNISIYGLILSYYTQAYQIFLILVPIVITNFLVIVILQWYDSRKLVKHILKIKDEEVNNYLMQYVLLNTLWHIIPLLWLWYILQRDNVIALFKPNFMGIFLSGAIFSIGYFYFASQGKYYGDIDYSQYMVIYVLILMTTCIICYLS